MFYYSISRNKCFENLETEEIVKEVDFAFFQISIIYSVK